MAELDSSNAIDTERDDRIHLALEAVWEIAALCKPLRLIVDPAPDQKWLAVRGLSARIEDLADLAESLLTTGRSLGVKEAVRALRVEDC